MSQYYPTRPVAPNATASLVLGILGLIVCPLCAPFAWNLGGQAERAARTGDYSGETQATIGKITGIVGTVLLVVYVFSILFFACAASHATNPTVHVGQ